MSMGARANVGGASASLSRLAARLDRVAAGESVARAAEIVGAQVEAEARLAIAGHSRSGRAASVVKVTVHGSRVQLAAPRYLDFHAWWPFREGLRAHAPTAARTLAEETARTLAG